MAPNSEPEGFTTNADAEAIVPSVLQDVDTEETGEQVVLDSESREYDEHELIEHGHEDDYHHDDDLNDELSDNMDDEMQLPEHACR